MGLALREAGVASAVVGHDKEPGASAQAKKLGAVDRTNWNLISACEDSDLVILATPLAAIEATMQAIGPYLRPGCVVMDTASLKEPVLAWAAEALPDEIHFVGGNPIVGAAPVSTVEGRGGLEAARADLFRNALFCLTPSPTAEPAAVKLVSDLVTILGAEPLFFDPAEHDGLLAVVEQLPAIVALALMETVISQPTWRELRKVAGTSFEVSTRAVSTDAIGYSEVCLSNRDNILRWMDVFMGALVSVRQNLAESSDPVNVQPEELTQRFEKAVEERNRWLHDRAQGQWESGSEMEMPAKSNMLADAFLGSLWRKRPKKDQ
jgi:prephenate dehydrogenase